MAVQTYAEIMRQHLTDEEYGRYIANVNVDYLNAPVDTSDPSHAQFVLAHSFAWYATPEGKDYWLAIQHRLPS